MKKLSFIQKYYKISGVNFLTSKFIFGNGNSYLTLNKGSFYLQKSLKKSTASLNFIRFVGEFPIIFRRKAKKGVAGEIVFFKELKGARFAAKMSSWIYYNRKNLTSLKLCFKVEKKKITLTNWNFPILVRHTHNFVYNFSPISLALNVHKGTLAYRFCIIQFFNFVKWK